MNISICENKIVDTKVIVCQSNKDYKSEDDLTNGLYTNICDQRGFLGNYKQMEFIDFAGMKTPEKYCFVGSGETSGLENNYYRNLFGTISTKLSKEKCKNINIEVSDLLDSLEEGKLYKTVLEIVEGLMLAQYSYDKYLSKKNMCSIENINLIVSEEKISEVKGYVEEAMLLAECTCIARDLTNEPSNYQTPQMYANDVKNIMELENVEYDLYDENYMKSLGMELALNVGVGSPNPPRLMVLRYKGNPDSEENIGLIGKGITYDSGGLSLKGKWGLVTMKADMAGSAAVIGAMKAIVKQELKVNVTVIVIAIENILSGNGYKPGDVIGSMGGKTVLITSTDGEGRLALADSIVYAVQKENITCAYDIATLTGAARQIFGGIITPVLSNNDEMFNTLEKAGALTGEPMHRMPMMKEARAILDCDVADLKNSSQSPFMRMITGGMFINEFVGDLPWTHIDISGAGLAPSNSEFTPSGGTGRGVRALYHTIKMLSKK